MSWNFFSQKYPDSQLYQKASLVIAAIFSIVLCLSFPLGFQNRFEFNFLLIPIGIAGLFGGAIISSILLVIAAPLLFLLSEEEGTGTASIVLVVQFCTNILLSPYFKRWKINKKMIIGTLLITIFSSVSIATTVIKNPSDHVILSIGLGIVFMHIVFVAFCFFLIETVQTKQVMKETLIKAEKMKGLYHLTAAFGHEIRQPITVCIGMLQLLNDDRLSKDKKSEYLFTTISEMNRAEKIIQDYQIFAEPFPNKSERLNLKSEIQKTLELFIPLANVRNIKINSYLSNAWINGDKEKLKKCLIHICTNAFEAMDSGGILTINSYSNKGKSIIEISDTGIGMTKKQISRLGEPFFSLNEQKGTGLGMMVVFRIVEGMKGEIDIQSIVGEGTKVKIVLHNGESTIDKHVDKELVS